MTRLILMEGEPIVPHLLQPHDDRNLLTARLNHRPPRTARAHRVSALKSDWMEPSRKETPHAYRVSRTGPDCPPEECTRLMQARSNR
jgi:hypothetical protein